MNKILKILLIGPQASGKGTQAQILSKKLKVPVFSTGNILRQKIIQADELGKQLAETINAGQLVADELVNKIIVEKIKQDGARGYILDGYPRNLSQAKFLDRQDSLNYVFEIQVSDREAIKRISGRRTCPQCQRVYHLQTNPPKNDNKCDKCGVELIVRDDEKPEIVKERLKNYHKLTEPILDYYKEKGVYYQINGEQSIVKVALEIEKVLGEELQN